MRLARVEKYLPDGLRALGSLINMLFASGVPLVSVRHIGDSSQVSE